MNNHEEHSHTTDIKLKHTDNLNSNKLASKKTATNPASSKVSDKKKGAHVEIEKKKGMVHPASKISTEETRLAPCVDPTSAEAHRLRRYFLSVGVLLSQESHFIEEWARHYISEVTSPPSLKKMKVK